MRLLTPRFSENKIEIKKSNKNTPIENLQEILTSVISDEIVIEQVQLHYIRQVNGENSVYYFTPEFAYILDIKFPRFPLISLPYEISREQNSIGDAYFPDFKEARVFSAGGFKEKDILYPAVVKEIIIGVKPNTTEEEVQNALNLPYVESLRNEGTYYVAEVQAFYEQYYAEKIKSEVNIVAYTELNSLFRSNSSPWFVDRVL